MTTSSKKDKGRFESKTKIASSGCWEWVGGTGGNGYGKFWFKGKNCWAHRASYEIYKGEIPSGATIDHICRNRACVNPNHLRVMSLEKNIAISESATAINGRKTYCKNGHPLFGDNLIIVNSKVRKPYRKCKKCSQDKWKEWKGKNVEKIKRARKERYWREKESR